MYNIPCKDCGNKKFRCFLRCQPYKSWKENRDAMLVAKWQYKIATAPIKYKWRCV